MSYRLARPYTDKHHLQGQVKSHTGVGIKSDISCNDLVWDFIWSREGCLSVCIEVDCDIPRYFGEKVPIYIVGYSKSCKCILEL